MPAQTLHRALGPAFPFCVSRGGAGAHSSFSIKRYDRNEGVGGGAEGWVAQAFNINDSLRLLTRAGGEKTTSDNDTPK